MSKNDVNLREHLSVLVNGVKTISLVISLVVYLIATFIFGIGAFGKNLHNLIFAASYLVFALIIWLFFDQYLNENDKISIKIKPALIILYLILLMINQFSSFNLGKLEWLNFSAKNLYSVIGFGLLLDGILTTFKIYYFKSKLHDLKYYSDKYNNISEEEIKKTIDNPLFECQKFGCYKNNCTYIHEDTFKRIADIYLSSN